MTIDKGRGAHNYMKVICPHCREWADSHEPEHYKGDKQIICANPECYLISRLTPNGAITIEAKRIQTASEILKKNSTLAQLQAIDKEKKKILLIHNLYNWIWLKKLLGIK